MSEQSSWPIPMRIEWTCWHPGYTNDVALGVVFRDGQYKLTTTGGNLAIIRPGDFVVRGRVGDRVVMTGLVKASDAEAFAASA